MNIKKYSFRYAEEILSNPKYKNVLSEILSICQNCPLPYYPGKSKKQPKLDIVQQIINTYFLVAFEVVWSNQYEPKTAYTCKKFHNTDFFHAIKYRKLILQRLINLRD